MEAARELERAERLLRQGQLDEALALLGALGKEALEPHEAGARAVLLAHALRYAERLEEAEAAAALGARLAAAGKDGGLMIATLCAQGELALARAEAKAALLVFARARGLSELGGERLSVLPLAGLAAAQARLGHAAKAQRNAEKARARARAAQEPIGEVRALAALAVATGEREPLRQAIALAEGLPHRPLAALLRRQLASSDPTAETDGSVT